MPSTSAVTTFTIPLDSLCRGKLNPTQWVVCELLTMKKWGALTKYLDEVGTFPWADVKDLCKRGYLEATVDDKETEAYPGNMKVLPKFLDLLYGTNAAGAQVTDSSLLIDDDIAFNELFSAYPPYLELGNGSKAPGRNMNYDLGAELYSLATKGKRAEHVKILELLEWGKGKGLITMGLEKFIGSRQWLSLQQVKESGEVTDSGAFNNDI